MSFNPIELALIGEITLIGGLQSTGEIALGELQSTCEILIALVN